MDKALTVERSILLDALTAARQHGVEAELLPTPGNPAAENGRGHAPRIRIMREGRHCDYSVAVKAPAPASAWPSMMYQVEGLSTPTMIVADYIPSLLAEKLRTKRIPFLDTAGNAFVEQDNLLISVEGRKRTSAPRKPHIGRAFQPTGLQVIFTLLCVPDAVNKPYRTLAAMAGVAHGTVGWVVPDLQAMGFIKDQAGKRGARRLFDRRRLCELWVNAYITTLRPRLLLGRLYARSINGWEDWPPTQHGFAWGGEPAAAVLTHYLKPGEMTLYAETIPSAFVARQAFLMNPGTNPVVVDIRKRFWHFESAPGAEKTVPPLLVYADLLATGDARCREAADMIYENHLVRLFEQT